MGRIPESAYDLIHRLALKGVVLDTECDDAGRPTNIVADDPGGRLDDADVAELRRHKRSVLDALELIDCLDLATPPRPPATDKGTATSTPRPEVSTAPRTARPTLLFTFDPRRTP